MALPLSGQISMNDIQVELGISEGDPGFSDFGLSEARNGTYVAINPCSTYKPPSTGQISLSDWYGYNQTQECPPAYELYTADRYECDTPSGPCSYVETIQIGNPTVLVEGKYYLDLINFYIFNIVGAPGAGPYLITDMSGLGTNNCNILCSV
jgi:hypothetical protein